MKIFEVTSTPKYMYHVTPSRNVKHIEKTGLVPSIGSASSSYGETEERLYFFPSKIDAEDAAMNWLADQYEDEILSLLQIDMSGIELKKDTVDWEYYTHQSISPDRIKVLSTDL
jgi:hypothetical protein